MSFSPARGACCWWRMTGVCGLSSANTSHAGARSARRTRENCDQAAREGDSGSSARLGSPAVLSTLLVFRSCFMCALGRITLAESAARIRLQPGRGLGGHAVCATGPGLEGFSPARRLRICVLDGDHFRHSIDRAISKRSAAFADGQPNGAIRRSTF